MIMVMVIRSDDGDEATAWLGYRRLPSLGCLTDSPPTASVARCSNIPEHQAQTEPIHSALVPRQAVVVLQGVASPSVGRPGDWEMEDKFTIYDLLHLIHSGI